MRTISIVALALGLALSGTALAGPFKNGDLFVNPAVKHRGKDRGFFAGASFQVAPVKALIQSEVKKRVDAMAGDSAEAEMIKEFVAAADTDQMRDAAASGKLNDFKDMLKEEMKAQGGLTPEQEKAIDAIDENKLRLMADLIEMYNSPPELLTFGLEPYVGYNWKALQISGHVPIAGFYDQETKATAMQLGNLGLDLRFGGSYGEPGLAFGWSLGVAGYGPTGTEDANAIALSNVQATPRYLHEYVSAAPYLVLGMDFAALEVSVHGSYVYMQAVRDIPDGDPEFAKTLGYVNAGAAARLNFKVVGVTLELDSIIDIGQNWRLGNLFLATAGVRWYLGPVQLGGAVQVPLVKPDSKETTVSLGGVGAGSMATYNVLLNAQVALD
jgi:hypothetical protein